jgi:uncharacterized membrane protein YgcG
LYWVLPAVLLQRASHLLATALLRSRTSTAACSKDVAALSCLSNTTGSSAWQQLSGGTHALLSTAVDATQQQLLQKQSQHNAWSSATLHSALQQRCFGSSSAHSSSSSSSSSDAGSGSSSAAGGGDALQVRVMLLAF